MAEVDSFLPTGLLQTSEPDIEEQPFIPTGLLFHSGPIDTDNFGEETPSGQSEGNTSPDADNSTRFVPTGLLDVGVPSSNSLDDDISQVTGEISQTTPDFEHTLRESYKSLCAPNSTNSTEVNRTNQYRSIVATTCNGKTVHLKRKIKTNKVVSRRLAEQESLKLLETPIHRLMDQLAHVTASKINEIPEMAHLSRQEEPVSSQKSLWVDRYRPSRFTDLLGDERVHRETMGWLKEWDYCVFGKRKPSRNKQVNVQTIGKYEDSHRRPKEKILLLSGPAGFGKTTLAHVVARQAGYDVMEINASDFRSGQIIDDRIRPALESGSAIGSKRPVCVVIDEIDGATGAGDNTSSFIHKLVSLTYERAPRKGKNTNGAKKTHPSLMRPIICICNDLYASSLTKLRQHARIIRFNRPADVHLTKRLSTICSHEGLAADHRALTALVAIARGDMRSCLNTLQFIKSRNQEVNEAVVRSATAGMKEGDASFHSVLSNIFSPLSRKRVKDLGLTEEQEKRYVTRLSGDIETSGTVDKLAMGCFEHYANLRHSDPSLNRHDKACDWLSTFDLFSGTMRSEREYSLLPYLSYTIVPFHPLFNERGSGKVERPKADWENLIKTRTTEEIFKSLLKRAQSSASTSSVRHLLAQPTVQLEFAPYINRIISPPLRPVNSQLSRPKEKDLLNRLVEIMVAFELRFVQEKSEDGQLVYILDPPVDAFVTYDGKRAVDIPVQRYATRHIVAAEIDAKLVTREAEAVEKDRSRKGGLFSRNTQTSNSEDASQDISRKAQKRKAGDIDPADRPPVDFFGRPITAETSKNKKAKTAAQQIKKEFRVTYRFNEGNSAAVRKPLKVSSFL